MPGKDPMLWFPSMLTRLFLTQISPKHVFLNKKKLKYLRRGWFTNWNPRVAAYEGLALVHGLEQSGLHGVRLLYKGGLDLKRNCIYNHLADDHCKMLLQYIQTFQNFQSETKIKQKIPRR